MRLIHRKDEFDQAFKEALAEAGRLYMGRTKTRDVSMNIGDKMAFGVQSFVTFIYMKACRLVQCILSKNSEHMHDELIDIIVYCAALLAYRRLEARDQEHAGKEDT